MMHSGPLKGVRVVEFSAMGPGPYCAMLLADMGADVLRIDRVDATTFPKDVHGRGKRSLALDLKREEDRQTALQIIEKADVLIEGFRPGVMESLGLGPEVALEQNPRLIYGRITGWGQTGPLATAAGHDINYIALTGALASIGKPDGEPLPPLNLVGDFGGGALFLAFGIAAALYERTVSGTGQVIDAAMVDGVSSLMSIFTTLRESGLGSVERGKNFLGGSAHYYRCYECADGKFIAIGSIEPKFYALLRDLLGESENSDWPGQAETDWTRGAETLAGIFKRRTQREWCELLEGTDACFAPVLDFDKAPTHPHMQLRHTYVERFGILQAAPAPRFSRTPGDIRAPAPKLNEGGVQAMAEWGVLSESASKAMSGGRKSTLSTTVNPG